MSSVKVKRYIRASHISWSILDTLDILLFIDNFHLYTILGRSHIAQYRRGLSFGRILQEAGRGS